MKNQHDAARGYVFLLLKFRMRSRKEIEERLKKKNFSKYIIEDTLVHLTSTGYIDDHAFARAWVRNRINLKPCSRNLLKYELLKKGVDKQIIDAAVSDINDETEYITARRIARTKLKKIKPGQEEKIKAKLFGYLNRRGFKVNLSLQIIKEVLNYGHKSD